MTLPPVALHGVVDTNGKFCISVTISVYLGKGVNISVVDTGGKFTTCVKDSCGSP
jgi:hypothetical protein